MIRCHIDPVRAALLLLGLLALACAQKANPQDVEVHAQIQINYPEAQKGRAHVPAPTVVLWLTPTPQETAASRNLSPPGHFRMTQKNKGFQPHLLVVPLGSTVSFPNLDPFFHNVFSQFNGKRFDLGLYEAGSTKDVHFDHEGVSYLFCNIHPEMSAVVVTLATPYFSISSGTATAVLHGVPAGSYEMRVWAEGLGNKELEALARRVHISSSQDSLGVIQLRASDAIAPHKNKFGDDYRPDQPAVY